MKQDIFIRIYAIILTIAVLVTSASAVQIAKVYAEEGETFLEEEPGEDIYYEEEDQDDYDDDYPEEDQEEDDDVIWDKDEPDPFDYDLACYTPDINLGTVYEGEYIEAKPFTIVNIGNNGFPITWEEVDSSTAFSIAMTSKEPYLQPGDSASYLVYADSDLPEGNYKATYTFFSGNDYRRHHVAVVNVSLTVKADEPYISSIQVVPGSVTVPRGKNYQFEAWVYGGNDYDASVSWSITEHQSTGTKINSNGVLTVGENETASSFVVLATSRQDPSYVSRSIVTVASVDHMVSVKAEPSKGGAVAGGGAVTDGDSVTVSASPNNNYYFVGWYEGKNLVSERKTATFTNITGDKTFVAKFERATCYVKTSVNDGDGGTVSKSISVDYGGKTTITAKAKDGYSFEGFVEDNKTISKATSLELNNITTDRNIVAVFKRDTCVVNVTVNPQDTGKYEGAGKYNKGSKVKLTTEAYQGYEFTGWTINGQVVCKDKTYIIEKIGQDVNVVANFMKKDAATYKITSGIGNQGGAILPSGDIMIAEGGSATFNIAPAQNYRIKSVSVDGKNIGAVASYTFNNVRGAHSIVASFEQVAPAASSKPAAASTAATSKTVAEKTKTATDTKEKNWTEYNKDTATEGAVPEQQIVEDELNEEIELLEEEDYADDTLIEAEEMSEIHESNAGGIMGKHNLDEDTLRLLINDDAVTPMLKEAFEDGTLQITVNNSYAADTQETAVETYYSKPTAINFQDVIVASLSDEEKYQVLTGTPISFNVDITENTDSIDEETKAIMQKKVGYKAVSYFDFLVMKTSNGTTSVINNTGAELEVVIPIPEQYRKEGRKFSVIRNHNGVVDVLQDIGDDPTTIRFRTNKFSEYAIAYEAVNVNKLILRFLIIAVIALILAVICFASLVYYRRKARRERRAARRS
ncbi:InlB B-repeat-containing protein [Butyrivibrio sp. MC2021]|uniref:InlB B-repeat-containing protein n=1 Tax=Butyrivibrio sp. MC2021 TaxID=1408306 RepID=UPI00047A5BFC|nr:InlB B-repeat-containing protein [Butyrivibrio sp. MC2021]